MLRELLKRLWRKSLSRFKGRGSRRDRDSASHFFETTKTTLTFDDGAVLNLKSTVVAGQTVFLRNDKSGKEIQCKVIEAPAEGQLGYTDLEFAAADPEFWGTPAEGPTDAGSTCPMRMRRLKRRTKV